MTRQLLMDAEKTLKKSTVLDSERNTRVEAEDIFLSVLRSRGLEMVLDLYTSRAENLTPSETEEINSRIIRRIQGESLHYVTGERDFLSSRYEVSPGVLIPRPETEVLVMKTIENILEKNWQGIIRGYELGLGSGVISIELIKAIPSLTMTGSEVSSAALSIAKKNAEKILANDFHRLKWIRAQSYAPQIPEGEPFHFLVSNPPYLDTTDETDTDVLRNEPHEALFPKSKNPNEFYEYFAEHGQRFLVSGGFCLMEISHDRSETVSNLFKNASWKNVNLISDLTQRPRFVYAEKPEN